MRGIAGCRKTACPVVTEGLFLATGHSILYLLRSAAEHRRKKRAVTVIAAPLQPKQRVRSESAAGAGTDSMKGKSTLARLAPKRSG